jgi:calcineurin-like phosphoesterase family protein
VRWACSAARSLPSPLWTRRSWSAGTPPSPPGDTVWHLGDFAVRVPAARAAALLDRLHGTKHLVAGNADGRATRALPGWASVQDYAELGLAGRRLVLCHYPLRAWNGQHCGAADLHGHSHGRLEPLPRQLDVGVDAWDFRPVGLDEILAKVIRPRVGRSAPT